MRWYSLLFGEPESRYTLSDVMRRLDTIHQEVVKIMATMEQTVAALAAAQASIDAMSAEVAKIGTETDGLIAAVAALQASLANAQTTPEVDAAVAAVQASVDSLAAVVKGVDDKVQDAA